MVKVSVVKCYSYSQGEVDKAVKKSLELINFKPKPKKKVLLKPNVLGADKPEKAITTHPSILKAVCKAFEGCEIFVGDSSGTDTKKSLEVSGLKKAAEQCKAKLLNFDILKLKRVESNSLENLHLPKVLFEVDIVVNLPKLKTHALTKFTGAIKNLYGCIPGGRKTTIHRIVHNEKKFSEMLAELHNIIKPSLNIMDGVVGMEGLGPSMGTPKKTNLILASTNAAALDYVAAEIIGFKPLSILSTKFVKEQKDFEVEVVGEKNVKVSYKKPLITSRMIPRFITKLIFKRKLEINKAKCEKCMVCVEHCPVGALNKEDLSFGKNCIECYCCQELCPQGAVEIKENLPPKLVNKARSLLRI